MLFLDWETRSGPRLRNEKVRNAHARYREESLLVNGNPYLRIVSASHSGPAKFVHCIKLLTITARGLVTKCTVSPSCIKSQCDDVKVMVLSEEFNFLTF